MSVLLIINSERDIENLTSWGLLFAKSLAVDLKIAMVKKAAKQTEAKSLTFSSDENEIVKNWLKNIEQALSSESMPSWSFYEDKEEDKSSKKQKYNKDDPIRVSLYYREHSDPTRASLMFAEKQSASLVVVRRLDEGKDDAYTNALITDCLSALVILKATTAPQNSSSGILVLASPGPNTSSALKFGSQVAKAMDLDKLNALNLEAISGNEASLVSKKQVENMAKKVKVDPAYLSIRTAPDGPLKKALLETSENNPFQLILLGSTEKGLFRRLFFGKRDDEVLALSKAQSIGVYRRTLSVSTITRKWLDRLLSHYVPQMDRDARISVFASLQSGSYWNFDFIALISLASAIASLGLIQNSAAIVIGAMLVAPLMTPMIGAGLGLVQGNVRLVATAAKTIGFGFMVSLGLGAFFAYVTGIESPTSEIAARGVPNILDLFVAFLSGTAAAYAGSRPNLSGALPGVAIAAALVPPITSAGICLTTGDLELSRGAATLFGLNLLAIILAAAVTLYAVGARPDRKEKKSIVWVQRCLIGLIGATIALTLPLATGFFKRFTKSPLRKIMELRVKEQGGNLKSYEWDGDRVILHINTKSKITKENLQPLVKSIRNRTGRPTQVLIQQNEVINF